MLLHSGGHVQPSCYYPDPTYFPQHATPPPPHFDIDAFLSHPTAYQGHTPVTPCPTPQQQTYYHHHHHHHHQDVSGGLPQLPSHGPYFSCSCRCTWKPLQETFLHKILTGKGYQNDAMCVGHHGHLFAAGPSSMDSGRFSVSQGAGSEFAMAATSSCCYAGRTAMSMPAAASFPPSIPGL